MADVRLYLVQLKRKNIGLIGFITEREGQHLVYFFHDIGPAMDKWQSKPLGVGRGAQNNLTGQFINIYSAVVKHKLSFCSLEAL